MPKATPGLVYIVERPAQESTFFWRSFCSGTIPEHTSRHLGGQRSSLGLLPTYGTRWLAGCFQSDQGAEHVHTPSGSSWFRAAPRLLHHSPSDHGPNDSRAQSLKLGHCLFENPVMTFTVSKSISLLGGIVGSLVAISSSCATWNLPRNLHYQISAIFSQKSIGEKYMNT